MNRWVALPTKRRMSKRVCDTSVQISNIFGSHKFLMIMIFSTFTGKAAKKDNSPATNTVAVADKSNTNAANDAVDTAIEPVAVQQVVAIQAAAPPKESPKNAANKEKSNKKKRNDALLIQQLGKN